MVINRSGLFIFIGFDTIFDSSILVFHFSCFDFQNKLGYSSRMTKLFKPSKVGHILEVDMNQDCHGLACRSPSWWTKLCYNAHECS